MEITYFRPPRPGPELLLQTAVAKQIPSLFPTDNLPSWAAGCLPVGAGMPDLVIISSDPEIVTLTHTEMPNAHILAYLRAVGCARLDTIVKRVRMSTRTVARCLEALVEARAVNRGEDAFSLSRRWRNILAEIITIEVKVEDWQRAVMQAGRNNIFAHRSYVALPSRVADRIREEPIIRQNGIGIIAVDDSGSVIVCRRAQRHQPIVWAYYYELASITARHFGSDRYAIRCAD